MHAGALYKLMPTVLIDSASPFVGAATIRARTPRLAQTVRYFERIEVRRAGMSTSELFSRGASSWEESLEVGNDSTSDSTCSTLAKAL